jgi:hypothetical protein
VRVLTLARADALVLAIAVVVAGALAGCGGAGSGRQMLESGRLQGVDVGARPRVRTPCVVHYGEGHVTTRQARGPGGLREPETRSTACYVSAECIAHHGVATDGDAFAEIECVGMRCVCRIEFLEPRPSKVEFRFEAESMCEPDERADRLLRERCIGQSAR